MRSFALFLLGAAPALAFVPPTPKTTPRTRVNLQGAQEELDKFEATGVSAPLGYFDPLGFANCEYREQRRLRECELKHGRVAMLAAVGFPLQEKFHPFFGLGDADMGQAIDHFQKVSKVAPLFWVPLVLAIAFIEGRTIARGWQQPEEVPPGGRASLKERDDYITGDLGLDPFNLKGGPANAFNEMRTRELNNGRLAMFAIIAMWVQELISNKFVLDQALPNGPNY